MNFNTLRDCILARDYDGMVRAMGEPKPLKDPGLSKISKPGATKCKGDPPATRTVEPINNVVRRHQLANPINQAIWDLNKAVRALQLQPLAMHFVTRELDAINLLWTSLYDMHLDYVSPRSPLQHSKFWFSLIRFIVTDLAPHMQLRSLSDLLRGFSELAYTYMPQEIGNKTVHIIAMLNTLAVDTTGSRTIANPS